MNKSNNGHVMTARKRISNADVEFYEDNIARMLHILNEVRGITLDVTEADLMEAIAMRLAAITESAGQTRRALIAHRDGKQLGGLEQ